MKTFFAIFGIWFALNLHGSEAHVRHHHKVNPVVAGLGAGFAHMLKSMQAHKEEDKQ